MRVNGKRVRISEGVVRILWKDKGQTIYLSDYRCGDTVRTICLDDCLSAIGYDGSGVVVVIFDDFQSGKVYHFGNYDKDSWYEYGFTWGFA